jgi:hypothetical protein
MELQTAPGEAFFGSASSVIPDVDAISNRGGAGLESA